MDNEASPAEPRQRNHRQFSPLRAQEKQSLDGKKINAISLGQIALKIIIVVVPAVWNELYYQIWNVSYAPLYAVAAVGGAIVVWIVGRIVVRVAPSMPFTGKFAVAVRFAPYFVISGVMTFISAVRVNLP